MIFDAIRGLRTSSRLGKVWAIIRQRRIIVPVCLVLILAVGGVFRFMDINWDDYTHLHPDERFIWMVTISLSLPKTLAQYFNTATSPLNPYNQGSSFIYGTLPIFLTKVLGQILGLGNAEKVHLLGRVLAGVFDLGTVLLAFFIGRRLYDERVGLLGSFLSACLVIHIQQSHFFTADSFVGTFVLLAFYCALRVVQRGSWVDFFWMGLSYGLAVASKINVILFGPILVLACLLRMRNALREPAEPTPLRRPRPVSPHGRLQLGGVEISMRFERFSNSSTSTPFAQTAIAADSCLPSPQVALRREVRWLDLASQIAFRLAFSLVVAFVAFRVVQPYTFQGPGFFGLKIAPAWLKDFRYWSEASRGIVDLPFSIQWTGRAPVLFSLTNMFLWAVGAPLTVASWLGWGLAWYELLRRRNLQHLLVLTWTTFFFLYQSTQFGKLSRYLTPFYPFMALLAGYLLVRVWDRAKTASFRWARPAAVTLALAVTLGALAWAYAFTRIYTRPLTRVTASLWTYDNIPQGSAIGSEHWDDAIPWGGVGGRNGYADGTFKWVEFHPYAEDEPQKLEWFVDWLNQSDYIILSSNRLYGSIPRLPMRYPMTTRYYKYLFGGNLGFELIKTFTSRPNIGPIEFNDDNAEEPFTVYDHPRVDVFRKTDGYSAEQVRHLLGDGIDWEQIARIRPIDAANWKNGLQMTDEEQAAQQAGGTWSAIFNRKSLSNAAPVLMWLLLVEVLGAVTLPLTYLIFSGLSDRGYILSKTLGILLLTWVTWIAVNLGLTGYSREAIGAALLLITACSAMLFWRKQEEMLAFWRANRQLVVINELLFLAFFGVFLLIRYGNPDLWHPIMGGEKPMDFAYLNAVIRSSVFPPYDPWFAGGYLNYYYFGQIIVATLIKFTGIVPWVAYNLAIPLLAALTAMGAFCVAYNLTKKEVPLPQARPLREVLLSPLLALTGMGLIGGAYSPASIRGPARPKRWPRELLWGLLAALMVAVLGNLAEIAVLGRALMEIGRVDARSSIPLLRDAVRVLSGAVQWLTGKAKPYIRPEWPYWNPSRVMPNGEINEFPFFTFLYADLHAHLIALPFGLLALGMAVSVVLQKVARATRVAGTSALHGASLESNWMARARQVWTRCSAAADGSEALLLCAVALVVGALRCINSWDYPTYLLVVGIALLLREMERQQRLNWQLLWGVAWRSAAVFALSNLFFQPFVSHFASAYVAFERWKGPLTGLGAYLTIHGLFLFAIVSWMVVELFGRRQREGATRMLRMGVRYWDLLPRMLGLYGRVVQKGREYDTLGWLIVVPMGLLLLGLALARHWFFLFVVLLMLGTLLIVLRWRLDARRRFIWMLFGLGLAISLGVDLVVLKGDIGRMNTVFKFYLPLWVFWSIAAAFALSELAEFSMTWTNKRRNLWWGFFGLLLFLAALYPTWAGKAKIQDRFDPRVGPSLDGMAYMTGSVYNDNGQLLELRWDYDAIQWLLDNVEGSPVIAEGNTEERGLYRWGSRVSIYTGMPTILGWSWHQRQQRSAMPGQWIDERLRDVTTLYRDSDPSMAVDILKKYNVRYVYLGELERIYYPGPGLDKFEAMRAQGLLSLAYHNERVSIYEVVDQ